MISFTKAIPSILRKMLLSLSGLTEKKLKFWGLFLLLLPTLVFSETETDTEKNRGAFAGPKVLNIAPSGFQSANETDVSFDVQFSKSVTGVDKSDFILHTSSNLEGVSITSVAGQGSLWFVRVKVPAESDGFVGIELKETGTGIVGPGGTQSTGFTSGQYHYVGEAFDIEKAVYKTYYTLPEVYDKFHFSNDGKKVFFLESSTRKIVEYDLATPYRIKTMEPLENAYSVILNSALSFRDFRFDSSGLKFFLTTSLEIQTYSLTKAFDLSTLVSTTPKVRAASSSLSSYLLFSNDGNKLFVGIELVGDEIAEVGEYELSGPYVIPNNFYNTHTHSKQLDEVRGSVWDIEFNTDGTKMFVLDYGQGGSREFTEYSMSEAYNASKLEYIRNHTSFGRDWSDIMFNNEGTIMYMLDDLYGRVYEYHMFTGPTTKSINLVGSPARSASSIQYEVTFSKPVTGVNASDFELEVSTEVRHATISSVTGAGDTYIVTISEIEAYADGHIRINLRPAGTDIRDSNDALLSTSYTKAQYHYAGAAYDVSRALYKGLNESFSLAAQVEEARSLSFNGTGKKMIVLGKDAIIRHYILSVAYDVSTATYEENKSFSVAGQHSNPRSLAFNNSGTKMYVLGAEEGNISEYSLSAAYNPSSATYSGDAESFSVKDRESDPTSLVFNDDGTKMFVLGTAKDAIQIYKLYLAFDVSTAVFQNTRSIANFETNPYSLAFNPDGTKMYILGADGDDISEFKLAGPYQPIDAVYAGNAEGFSTRTQDNGPRSLAFGAGGARMFVLGKTSNRIHEFDMDSSPPRLTEVSVFGNPEPDATSVRFFAFFNESVTGGNVSDFEVKASEELSGATVTEVHKSGSRYTVTVSGIPASADGTLSIGLKSSGSSIKDIEGQEAISGFLSPEYHYVGAAFNTAKAAYAGSNSSLTLDIDNLSGMAFGKEGKSLFILSENHPNSFYEYTLDIPYEVSCAATRPILTASFIKIENGKSIYFNKEGTVLFVLGNSQLYEHVLNNAYTPSNQILRYENMDKGRSIALSSDGRQLIILKKTGINTYGLDEPFSIVDPILQTETTSFLVNEADPRTLSFNLDGTRLFILGNENKKVQFYDLTTPFDLSTLQYSGDDKSLNIEGQNIASPQTILFNEGGTGLFVLDKATSTIHKYYMDSNPAVVKEIKLEDSPMTSATSVDFLVSFSKRVIGVEKSDFELEVSEELEGASVSTVSGNGPEYVVNISNIPEFADGTLSISLKTSGTGIKDEVSGDEVKNYIESDVHYAGAAFNISRAVFTDKSESFSVKDKVPVARSLAFSQDGTKMFVLGKNNQTIYEYVLSEPFEVSTATFIGTSFSVAAEETNPRSITFSNDGKALFVLGTDSDKVHKYKVIRPFDLSTANLLGGVFSFSVKEKTNDARSLTFSRSGDKMFVLAASSVKAYDLPIPFDITTAKFSATVSIEDQESKSWSLAFNPDGTEMYVLGNEGDKVVRYHLQTAYDITSAVYSGVANELSVAENEESPRSMHFNHGGTKLFVMGNEGDDFHEYDLNTVPTTVTITTDAPYWIGGEFKFTIKFSSEVPAFSKSHIRVSNGTISHFKKVSPTLYTAQANPEHRGAVKVQVLANSVRDPRANFVKQSNELYHVVDDSWPVFTYDPEATVSENTTGTVYTVVATDETAVIHPLTYGLGNDRDEHLFNINSLTGEVTFKTPPDFESPLDQGANNIYNLHVTAADQVHTNAKLVKITVTNLIDIAPVFSSPKNVSFVENETLAAYQPKATGEEKVTFGFSSAYDRSLFKWENGKLFFKEAPDFESPLDGGANNTYKIQVNANEGDLQTSQLVTITITNVENEGKPVITSANGRAFYENNTGFAYKIVAVDENPLTYSLGTNKDEAFFNITDNVIHFKTPPDFETPLDADANNVYDIKVIASDGTYEAAKTVQITVKNKDEIPPVFTSSNQANFIENGTGTVYTALATDQQTVTYELDTDNDEAFFNLSESTGLLTFKASPDFENPKDADEDNSYLVNILAKDKNNSTAQLVTITVTDEFEDVTGPLVIASDPADGERGFDGTSITLTFDENILKGTGRISILNAEDNTEITGAGVGSSRVTIVDDKATFSLPKKLPLNKKVYVRIPHGAFLDNLNNKSVGVVDKTTLNFSTRTSPQLISSNPANDTVGFGGTKISLIFDRDMFVGASRIAVYDAADDSEITSAGVGSSRVVINNNVVTFDLIKALPLGKQVYVKIPAGALKDASNTFYAGIQEKTSLSFSTATRPQLVSTNPSDEATRFGGTTISFTFDRNMIKGSGRISVKDALDDSEIVGAGVGSARVSIIDNVVTLDLINSLPLNKEVYVNMPASAFKDANDNFFSGLLTKNSLNFSTQSSPQLVSSTPADGDMEFNGSTITLTFDRNIIVGAGRLEVFDATDDSPITGAGVGSGRVTVVDNVVTFDLIRALPTDKQVYVKVPGSAFKDAADVFYEGILDTTTLGFVTTTTPQITSTNPVDGATDFSGSTITFTFDRDVIKGSGRLSVFNAADDSQLTGAGVGSSRVTIVDNVVTFDLVKALPAGTSVYVKVPGSAFKDANNRFFKGMLNKTTLNFTTLLLPSENNSLNALEELTLSEDVAIVLYPNPANQMITLDLTEAGEEPSVRITDATGAQKLNLDKVQQSKLSIDVSQYAGGMYIAIIRTKEGQLIRKKFMIRR